MKKALAWLAALALGLTMAGCSRPEPVETTVPYASHPPLLNHPGDYSMDYRAGTVVAGQWVTVPQGNTPVSYNNPFPGGNGKDYTDKNYYTFRQSLATTSSVKWSPLAWENAADECIASYTSSGFYAFVPNKDLTGFTIMDEMAQGKPKDVTAQYAGQFGIQPGETGRAWRISLNPNACWANGTGIDADTYLYSYKELLNPKMQNAQAKSLFRGEFAIVGAKDYLEEKAGWSAVGILKDGQYGLVFITASPMVNPDFSVPYALQKTFLVYAPMWEQCKTYYNASGAKVSADSAGIASITCTYSTSTASSMSYGPYKIISYTDRYQVILQRNPFWYGYADGRHLGQYQADEIRCQIVSDPIQALPAFLNGELDIAQIPATGSIPAQSATLPQATVTALTFNTAASSLSQRGSQILSNANFRRGFSLAIDRNAFVSGNLPERNVTYGLLHYGLVSDLCTGATYRDTEQAKNALAQFYKTPESDDSVAPNAAITGYNLTLAQQFMQLGYDEAVESGLYDGQSHITLQLSVPQNDDRTAQMLTHLDAALRSACVNTGFEGKISLHMAVDADCESAIQSGRTDMIFSSYASASQELYSQMATILEADGFDDSVNLTIKLDGKDCTASLHTWAKWCAGNNQTAITQEDGQVLPPFAYYDAYTRSAIYADLEFAYLSQVVSIPLCYCNETLLLSKKGQYPTEDNLNIASFGGIAFYRFDYTDSQWSKVK